MPRALALGLVLCALSATSTGAQTEFKRATAPRSWEFPADHGSHPAYGTEWWYFTGSVFDSENHRFGYELTFFRVGLRPDLPEVADRSSWRARDLVVAHLTVTDVEAGQFHQAEDMQRAAAGLAGARTDTLDVWVGSWRARWQEDGSIVVTARDRDFGVDLQLRPSRAPVLHGDGGLSWKNAAHTEASHYVTQPRMHTSGALVVEGRRRPVSGSTWMDHEFFTGSTPRDDLGWDWFSARLSDGQDLMLYRVRRPGEAATLFGTVVSVDGNSRALDVAAMRMEETRWWESPHTGARYPVEWSLELPREALKLSVRPTLDDQEVDARHTVGFSYWEGLCDYGVLWDGHSLSGEGYVELTGYPSSKRSRP